MLSLGSGAELVEIAVRKIASAVGIIGVCLLLFGFAGASAQSTLPGPSIGNAILPPPSTPTSPAASTAAPMAASANPSSITDENYRLGTRDKLRINVYGEQDLSGEFFVDDTGHVQLPLVGQVTAAGLTVHQFLDEVKTALSDGYLRDPKVSVEVQTFRPFYIMGEVNKPGEYPYESGLTVRRAVALAGGYTYRANDSKVYIRHVGTTDEITVNVSSDERIAPGDIVRVPERLF